MPILYIYNYFKLQLNIRISKLIFFDPLKGTAKRKINLSLIYISFLKKEYIATKLL